MRREQDVASQRTSVTGREEERDGLRAGGREKCGSREERRPESISTPYLMMVLGVIRVSMPSWTVMSPRASACVSTPRANVTLAGGGVLGVRMPRCQVRLAPVRTRAVMHMVHSVVGLRARAATAPPFRCIRRMAAAMVMPAAVEMFIMRIRIIFGRHALVLV